MSKLVKIYDLSRTIISMYEEVSSYNFTNPISFHKVNCDNSNTLCEFFNINNKYPKVKLILNGKENKFFPMGIKDKERLLEFVDKLISKDIITLKSMKAIFNFSKNYGDVSFLLIDEENTIFYKCFENTAQILKPMFYFAFIKKSLYRNVYNIKLPAIIV